MPELPEVQTIASQLGKKIVGKKIVKIWSDWRKAVRPSLTVFQKRLSGKTILSVRRAGKHIIIDCSDGISFVIHLKMTGHLLVKTDQNRASEAFSDPYNQYIHHRIFFSDKSELAFSDMRKFGWMEAAETNRVELLPSIAMLGPDALSKYWTARTFGELLDAKPKMPIGALLLKQDAIAGIGNIYRSEALFQSGILPDQPTGSLSEDERAFLLQAVRKVLRNAISKRGLTGGDFRDTDGLPGALLQEDGVYGRVGKPCPKCGTIIRKMSLGQRSAFWCASCQH